MTATLTGVPKMQNEKHIDGIVADLHFCATEVQELNGRWFVGRRRRRAMAMLNEAILHGSQYLEYGKLSWEQRGLLGYALGRAETTYHLTNRNKK